MNRLLMSCIPFSLMLISVFNLSAQSMLEITHGIASGDITNTTAVVWARANREAKMMVRYQPIAGSEPSKQVSTRNAADTDFTAQVQLTNLVANTRYRYEVWFEAGHEHSSVQAGSFKTAPTDNTPAPVSFIWGGDLGGQTYCRQAEDGYAIFQHMLAFDPDFFIANGDMIYADNECPEQGPEGRVNVPGDFVGVSDSTVDWQTLGQVQEVFNAHWRYNRADAHFQAFLRQTPMYVQWDDHEVINDFGGRGTNYSVTPERRGYPNIVTAGRKAMFDFQPMMRHPDEPDRIYRSVRWGRELEVFIIDARSYRSENMLEDRPENAKTLLGLEQLKWLQEGLAHSTATWKVVSSDVPLAIGTGSRADEFGRDAFANGTAPGLAARTGAERELLALLRSLDQANVRNLVFVATDVHFAAQIRYENDFDGDGDPLLFHELISGPLSAVRNPAPPAFDPTLHPVVLYAEGGIFNFGTVRLGDSSTGTTHLWTDIRDDQGRIRAGSELELGPQ